jgi:hypothetical protein
VFSSIHSSSCNGGLRWIYIKTPTFPFGSVFRSTAARLFRRAFALNSTEPKLR